MKVAQQKWNENGSDVNIPLNILLDRNVAVLEAIVEFLKDRKNLTYHEIAVLTNRNDRTIWTVYSRVRKKRGVQK